MTNYINDETIEKVKESMDIVEIVSDYVPLKKAGANHVGLCPFHNEKTPSFTVSDSKQFFHCFGCGEGGDAISFLMKKENIDFIEAITILANRYGIEIEESKVDDEYIKEREKAFEINRDAARFFHNTLIENKAALEYLKARNIGPKIIRQFGLGFTPDDWNSLYDHLTNKGYDEKEIEKVGLVVARKGNNGYYDRFRNRIMFPIIDTKSRVMGFGGRILDHTMPKYLNSKESNVFDKGSYLYGLNMVNKHSNRDKIILVEGYMDVIALFLNGISYSVASLGTSLTQKQSKLLKRYGKQIYICFDSDSAGIKASLRAIDIMVKEGADPRIIMLPSGMDPDDYINKYGLLEFEKLMVRSLSHIDYKIHSSQKKYDLNNVEHKIKFTMEVAEVIKDLKSPVEQDVYIKKISQDTGISVEAIKDEIKNKSIEGNRKYKGKQRSNIEPVKYEITSGNLKAELNLIRLMMEEKDYFEFISNELSSDDFSSKDFKSIFKLIKKQYNVSDNFKIENIDYENGEEEINRELIQSIIDTEIKYEETQIEEIIHDLIKTVIYNNLEKEIRTVLNKIEQIEKKAEKDEEEYENFKNLCLELTQLNKEIKLISRSKGGS